MQKFLNGKFLHRWWIHNDAFDSERKIRIPTAEVIVRPEKEIARARSTKHQQRETGIYSYPFCILDAKFVIANPGGPRLIIRSKKIDLIYLP